MRIQEQHGVVLFFTVLLIGTAMIIALASFSRAGIDTFVQVSAHETARTTRAQLFGCLDLLLIELQGDSNFADSTIISPDATCALQLTSPTQDTREAQLTLIQEDLTRGIFVELSVQPVTVTAMREMF